MNLTTRTTLLLLAAAGAIAWYLGGRVGVGVMSGFLAGASIAGLSLALQRRIARERPRFVLHATFAGFLLKAFALLGLTLVVALVPSIAAVCDPVAFLITFAATAIAILLPATLDTLKTLTAPRLTSVGGDLRGLGGRTP